MEKEAMKLPKRYRPLYHKLRCGAFSAAELAWLVKSDPKLPPLLIWTAQEKLRLLGASAYKAPAPADPSGEEPRTNP